MTDDCGQEDDCGEDEYSLMYSDGDDALAGMEVTAMLGDQPVCSARIIDLVLEWIDMESLGGELHPYLDSTLNTLSDLTYVLLKVVERMEADDPHRAVLAGIYDDAYQYVQCLVDAVNDDTPPEPRGGED